MKRRLFYVLLAALMLIQASHVGAQSGGSFEIKQSVVANGGGTVTGGIFSIESTIGQPAAGTLMFGGNFSIYNGYGQPLTNQCAFSLNASSASASAAGGLTSPIQVNAAQNCVWTATSNANWISVNSGANGTGSGSVVLNAVANGGSPRSGTATIAGFIFTVFQDGSGSTFFTVSGSVTYAVTPVNQAAKFVPGVNLFVPNSQMTTTTNNSGAYALSNLAGGAQYTVSASKTGNVNGINSLDATRVQQYLVGLTTLTPAQIAAADVNNSGTVNSLDATRLQQYLVGVPAAHNIGQWRFLPSTRQYNSISGDLAAENYQAVLIGEVSGNWTAASGFAESPEPDDSLSAKEGVIVGETGGVEAKPIRQSAEKSKPQQSGIAFGDSTPRINPHSSDKTQSSTSKTNVSLPNVTANAGNVVEIPITIGSEADNSIESFDFSVFYDPAVLQPASPLGSKTGTLSRDCSVFANTPAAGSVRVSAACGAAPIDKGQGTLFVLRFNVLAASGQIALSFRDPATNEDTFVSNDGVTAKASDGSLTANETSGAGLIGGRILGGDGRPVFKAQVTLTDENGNVRHAVTNQLGYYRFADAQIGHNYVIGATHKQFRFDSQNVSRSEKQNEINFVASESLSEENR